MTSAAAPDVSIGVYPWFTPGIAAVRPAGVAKGSSGRPQIYTAVTLDYGIVFDLADLRPAIRAGEILAERVDMMARFYDTAEIHIEIVSLARLDPERSAFLAVVNAGLQMALAEHHIVFLPAPHGSRGEVNLWAGARRILGEPHDRRNAMLHAARVAIEVDHDVEARRKRDAQVPAR